jgi:hypothetical protein
MQRKDQFEVIVLSVICFASLLTNFSGFVSSGRLNLLIVLFFPGFDHHRARDNKTIRRRYYYYLVAGIISLFL